MCQMQITIYSNIYTGIKWTWEIWSSYITFKRLLNRKQTGRTPRYGCISLQTYLEVHKQANPTYPIKDKMDNAVAPIW